MSYDFEVTIRSSRVRHGFPFKVVGCIISADREVGIQEPYLEDVTVLNAPFFKLSKEEEATIKELVWDELEAQAEEY